MGDYISHVPSTTDSSAASLPSVTMHPFLAAAALPPSSLPFTTSEGLGPASSQQSSVMGVYTPPPALNPANPFLLQPTTALPHQQQRNIAAAAVPSAPLPSLPMFPSYALPTAYPSAFPQAQLLQLQAQAALAASSRPASASQASKVKVLLTSGGMSSTSAAGVWDYIGGETRLLGGLDPTNYSFADLSGRVEAGANLKLGVAGFLKYELPGCPGTLVDVKSDEDVANMWSELADFCNQSNQPTFKLHLYVERPSTRASSMDSHGSRNSGGSPSEHTSGSIMSGGPPPQRTSLERQRTDDGGTLSVLPGQEGLLAAGASELEPRRPSLDLGPDGSPKSRRAVVTLAIPVAPPPAPPTPTSPPKTKDAPQPAQPQQQQEQQAAASKPAGGNGWVRSGPVPTVQPFAVGQQQQPRSVTQSLASFDRLLTRVKSTVEIIRPADLRIIRFIGSGGFADCYLARWLGVEVAVKCLRDMPGAHTSSRASVKELLREASVLSGLRHPNVLCLYAIALPDKLSIEYGIGPAAQQAALQGSAGGSGPGTPSTAPSWEHTQLATVLEAAGDEDESSNKSDSDQQTRAAQALEVQAQGSQTSQTSQQRSGSTNSTDVAAAVASDTTHTTQSSQPSVDTPTKHDTSSATTLPSSNLKVATPAIAAAEQQAVTTPTAATAAQPGSVPTSPFAATAVESPFALGADTAPSTPVIARGQYAVQSSPAELEALPHAKPPIDVAVETPPGLDIARQLTSPSPLPPRSPANPDRPDTGGLPPTHSVINALAMPSAASSVASPHSGVSSVPGSSLVSYGIKGCTGTMSDGRSVASASVCPLPVPPSTRSSSPPPRTEPASSTGADTEQSTLLNNNDEDEGMSKAVQAAEAAAAASADAESQTAVSEGLITRPALVAEFLSGCSVAASIDRKADFLASDLVLAKIAMDAARGMEYCHGKRITHWNLKTGNLIVGFSSDKVPLCKVADVGLGRPRQLAELDDAGVARVLPWAAPELVRAPTTATEKVDVYSFGMVLWSLWARKRPFDRSDMARVFLRTMQGHNVRPPIPGTPEWDATYPDEPAPKEPAPGWSALLQRCWDTDPAARPPFSEVSTVMTGIFNSAKAAKRAARAAAAKSDKHHAK